MYTLSSGSELTHISQSRGNSGLVQSSLLNICLPAFPRAQSALNTAVGLTMPQRTQNFLIHILLLWTTIMSIIQIVIIIFFFTAGHKGLDSSAVEPSKMPYVGTVNSLPVLSQGKMLTFKASEAKDQIKWTASNSDKSLISDKDLEVKVDGYYFLNLQVSLLKCNGSSNHIVSLMKICENEQHVLLEGSIDNETCSTGVLNKVEELGAGAKLVVNINPSVECVNDSQSKTHLDIIFMLRP